MNGLFLHRIAEQQKHHEGDREELHDQHNHDQRLEGPAVYPVFVDRPHGGTQ